MAEPSPTLDRFEIRGSDNGRNYIRVPVGVAIHDDGWAGRLPAELVGG